ncbi:unnamed protein product, partial [Ectocarpus sp. 4 AP-2014]
GAISQTSRLVGLRIQGNACSGEGSRSRCLNHGGIIALACAQELIIDTLRPSRRHPQ